MKILKHGKVEMRKFVCPSCGCIFAESKQKLCELTYGFHVTCPQEDCGYEFTDEGEPYEEPTQDDRERLDGLICDLFNREPISRECIVDYLIQHGVTFREG